MCIINKTSYNDYKKLQKHITIYSYHYTDEKKYKMKCIL